MTIFESSALVLATLATTSFIIFYGYCKWTFLHWQRLKLPYLQPSVPFGNCRKALTGKECLTFTMKRLYDQIKQNGWKHSGIFVCLSPNYLPTNLDIIKNIMVNDFDHFTDRPDYYNDKNPLSANLIICGGEQWRKFRPKLTPCFTSSKLKRIFKNLGGSCQNGLIKKMEKEILKNEPIDIHNIFVSFTLDIMGCCVYGWNLNLFENETSPFKVYLRRITNKTTLERLFVIFTTNFPNLAEKLKFSSFPEDVEEFFVSTVEHIVDFREKHKESHNDFLQLLIDMMKKSSDLTIEEIAAQCFALAIAGFDTTACLMTFALYELAMNPEIQEKLRSEIEAVLGKHNGEISYDSIQDIKYLNQVIDECLRLYPPVPFVNRKCVKDYKIPDEDVVLKKDTIVAISILGIHHDEDYYPDPEKFDPDRFSEANTKLRHKCSFLPFGAGPRTCIGMHFALLEVKMAVICLIRNFRFSVDKKTSSPIKMLPSNFTFTAAGGIWLNATKIQQ